MTYISNVDNTVRTRIAPSPTGEDLHIGNAYTALVNYVFAQKNNGRFIVRIEDTDRVRLVPGAVDRILSSLEWLGIGHDEGPDIGGPYKPYTQSERLPIYKKLAIELVKKDLAYFCFCTPGLLAAMRKDQESRHLPPMYDGTCRSIGSKIANFRINKGEAYTIRLKVPREGSTSFYDIVRGDITFANKLIDDQVLLKSDGFPTYHLGVVVDDHAMDITHVIRGEEWISSTPKHILIYRFLGLEPPVYAHLPVLRSPDKSKLSKRKNPVWVSWYREGGFLPEAIRNYLALMAWAHPEGKEIFSTSELIDKFELDNVQTTAPVFDIEKLRWLNGEYIRRKNHQELAEVIYTFFNQIYPIAQISQIIPLVVERMKTLVEFATLAGFFFSRPSDLERIPDKELLMLVKNSLMDCNWSHDQMEKSIRQTAAIAGKQAKDLFMELRIAVTGKSVGPPLLESLEILGKDETLERLRIVLLWVE